jgi:hypothetical protein
LGLIEEHLLPLLNTYYAFNLDNDEYLFAREYFTNLDEYFTIKTVASYEADLAKLHYRYAHKYFKLRKWLYIHDFVTAVS